MSNNMKTLLTLMGALSLGLGLAGCDQKADQPAAGPATKTAEATASAPSTPAPGRITVVNDAPAEKARPTDPGAAFRTYNVQGESQIQYAPEGQDVTEAVKNVQVVVAARNSPYGSINANLLSKRLSKEFILLCSACHDDYGNGVVGPSLIDKNEQEVRDMIQKYTDDPNANVLMADLVRRMSPEQIDFIAKDLARFNAEVQAEKRGLAPTPMKEIDHGRQ